MKNNIIIKKINIVLSVLFLYSCIDQMQDAGDAKKVTSGTGDSYHSGKYRICYKSWRSWFSYRGIEGGVQ